MNLSRNLVLLCLLPMLLGCALQRDWGEDHVVLDELQLLEESDLWIELFGFPTRPAGCDLATCQNVIGGTAYEIIGDVDEAKVAALDEVVQRWVLTSDADPYQADSSNFQLHDDVDIETSTGTAFITVYFMESFDLLEDEPVPNAIVFSFTSDADPNWMNDRVFARDNLFSPGGLGLMFSCLALGAALLRRKGEAEALRGAE